MSLITSDDNRISGIQLNFMSAQTLAFVGDAVYSLLVREYLAKKFPERKNLHNMSVADVNCHAQSLAAELLIPVMTEKELAVYKRGRNMNSVSSPKRADVVDYRRATGVEALFGWLYLSGNDGRIKELFAVIEETMIQ